MGEGGHSKKCDDSLDKGQSEGLRSVVREADRPVDAYFQRRAGQASKDEDNGKAEKAEEKNKACGLQHRREEIGQGADGEGSNPPRAQCPGGFLPASRHFSPDRAHILDKYGEVVECMDKDQSPERIEQASSARQTGLGHDEAEPSVFSVVEDEGEDDEDGGQTKRDGGQGEEEAPAFEFVLRHKIGAWKTDDEGEKGAQGGLAEAEAQGR